MATQSIRSALFVPGDRGERIPKALASGADGVIVDLEDAVALPAKALARQTITAFLDSAPEARVLVRINAASTDEHEADLALASHPSVLAVLLPKAETAAQVQHAAQVTGKPIWPIVESAAGVLAIAELARAAGVERLALGTLDLALDLDLPLGTESAERMLDQARFALVAHSRAAKIAAPIDGVFPTLDDSAGLSQAAARARSSGMGGALCIHPRQVAQINAAFTPSASEIDWAGRVLEAAAKSKGAFTIDGRMVDAPVIELASRILRRAGITA
jgi:(S)-citramalyl-CoA lyase